MNKEIESKIEEIKSNIPVLKDNCPNQIIRAINIIHGNLFEYHLTIDWIKKEGHISNKCFSSLFKKYLGSYPKNYILTKRIIAAKVLMKETNLSISMIAIHTGFQSVSAFCNTFKNRENMQPSAWRMKIK